MRVTEKYPSLNNHTPADVGCAIGGPSCLRCPLPECIEELDQGLKQSIGEAHKVVLLLDDGGWSAHWAMTEKYRLVAREIGQVPNTVKRWQKSLRRYYAWTRKTPS